MKISGVKTVNRNGKAYYYHRKTGQRLLDRYGSRKFVDQVTELNFESKARPRVYFIRQGKYVKIGVTKGSVKERLEALQVGTSGQLKILGWVYGDHALEKDLHHEFVEYRKLREWFQYTGKLKARIEYMLGNRTRTERAAENIPEMRKPPLI